MRLPGEIRNYIYKIVLGGHTFTLKELDPPKYRIGTGTIDLAILRVCRQLHREARLFPFSLNTFHFDGLHQLSASTLSRFTISQLRALTRVEITKELIWGTTVDCFLRIMRIEDRCVYDLLPGVRFVDIRVLDDGEGDLDQWRFRSLERLKAWFWGGGEGEVEFSSS